MKSSKISGYHDRTQYFKLERLI